MTKLFETNESFSFQIGTSEEETIINDWVSDYFRKNCDKIENGHRVKCFEFFWMPSCKIHGCYDLQLIYLN